MSNRDKVLSYLRSIYPQQATNADIVAATRIEPHQQVYQLTSKLRTAGKITATQQGREWYFSAKSSVPTPPSIPVGQPSHPPLTQMDDAQFESFARERFSAHFGTPLRSGGVPKVHKKWDMLSDDGTTVGDAKYYTLVRGSKRPSAKFSAIAEHVWLLEKTAAEHKFLVFGNQIEVPQQWLGLYGDLVTDVLFYFLDDKGNITLLK